MATAKIDAFLQIDGIQGECTEDKHKDWIELESWSWGCTQASSSSHSTAGGSAAGKAEFSDITITILLDNAFPKIFEHCVKGTHIKNATLEMCRPGGTKFKYLEIKLENLLITNFVYGIQSPRDRASGGQGTGDKSRPQPEGDEFPTGTITFNYGKVKTTYFKQNEKGGGAGQIAFGWDLTTSKSMA